ncbi:LysR family transcriptional regulator [Paracoccus sp. Z330]|uniref:LysR family transcriptional regulator n=1 Tax=Paracoccus onchidii TaxID=3017813 RepID=A0ABT4ZFR7_9RHOB|nr:LysR family transcriptional regulator [Paracoccus onchidii]MDB6178213.1 LysR family transcriptional regulator [Paracoccus onchidii]
MEKNLAAFMAVARLGSLTLASDHLGLTQPSVTKRIANLEADFDTPLFERSRRGMTLTEAGELVLNRAKRIEDEYRYCREEIATIRTSGLSVLRVAAGPLFHLSWVSGLFASLKDQFPQLRLELIATTSQPNWQALLNGQIDVYLGVLNDVDPDADICSQHVAMIEHGIVLRPDHRLAHESPVDLTQMTAEKWVIFGSDPETESRLRRSVSPQDDSADIIDIRTASFSTGLQLVKDGPFVMSAPLQLANHAKTQGLLILPTLQGLPRREAGIHMRPSSKGYGAMQAILKHFESVAFP